MGVVATLLKQVPAAERFKPKLQAMESELAQLRTENARLKLELAQYIERWETLDGPQVCTLQYLAAHAKGHAAEIAKAAGINIQIAETSLLFLEQCAYVARAVAAGRRAGGKHVRFCLSPKGARYLQGRGLHP